MPVTVPDSDLSDFWVHVATVETYQGVTGSGVAVYAAANDVPCYIERQASLVRGSDGEQVVSSTQVYVDPSLTGLFTDKTRVTIDGVTSTVIAVSAFTSSGLDLPDHTMAALR
jgi:hypothetical protein